MDPFTAMMIIKGVSTVMNHQGQQAAAAARNAAKYRRDLAIKSKLQAQYSNARQAFADADISRVNMANARAETGVEARLNEMRVASTIKASGVPQGQSTKNLISQAIGQTLRGETKFHKELEMKTAQLALREREIQQGMDMAWLDAKSQIEGTSYSSGPGMMNLALGLGSAYLGAKSFDNKMDGSWDAKPKTGQA